MIAKSRDTTEYQDIHAAAANNVLATDLDERAHACDECGLATYWTRDLTEHLVVE
jgi:hypothetical protein